ncbi:MAG: low molecular weight protein-tyrosine-phosphatase [Pseudomonadota bacterium]
MSDIQPVKVLFVCMGNICRSPTAHGVFRDLVAENKLSDLIQVDSAGTHSYHTGSPPDLRSQAVASENRVDLSDLRARRFESADFSEFDYVIGMDQNNMSQMRSIQPEGASARFHLMLEFSQKYSQTEVPDPYFGEDGFDLVFDMISDASKGLLSDIKTQYKLQG